MNESDATRAILKLNELTRAGVLRWTRDTNTEPFVRGTDRTIEVFFHCRYGSRNLRLFEFVEPDKGRGVELQLLDEKGVPAYRFPPGLIIEHLLESVKFQTSKVSDFIRDVLDASATPTTNDILDEFSKVPYWTREAISANAHVIRDKLTQNGIETIGQLRQLVASQDIIDWLSEVYVRELGRETKAPLDPEGFATWGAMLFIGGMGEAIKAKIKDNILKSKEFRKRTL